MTGRENAFSEEKQRYIALRAHNKQLYKTHNIVNETQDKLLSMKDTPALYPIVQQLNEASRLLMDTASKSYFQQKQIEKAHPEFAQEALEYAKRHQQAHRQEQQH